MISEGPSAAIESDPGTHVRGIAASPIGSSRRLPWRRRHGFFLHLAGCFVSVFLAAAFVDYFNQGWAETNFIWLANGLLLAYLLLAPHWRWAAYLCAGSVAQLSAGFLAHGNCDLLDAVCAALNVSEVLMAALLLRQRSAQLPRFTDRAYLVRFLGYAVLAAPAVTGLLFTFPMVAWRHSTPWHAFIGWAGVDALGMAAVTPTVVAIFQARFRSAKQWRKNWIYLALLAVVTIAALLQTSVPVLPLAFPLLIMILLGLGLGWAALATLLVAALRGWFAIRSRNPSTMPIPGDGTAISLQLQAFVVAAMLMLYIVSVVLEKKRATELRLRKIAAQHNLVTENSRDVIILADIEGRRTFISPAAEILTGWKLDQLLKQKSIDLVHPDDQAMVKAARAELVYKTEGSILEYRIRKVNDEYIWVQASLRVIRDADSGQPSGLLNMVRDITERKQAEQQLQDAFHAMEMLAVMDGLTGLPNRRRFDQCLVSEWRRALRDRRPLSLLVIDADLFKSYNDNYGHLGGDSCLRQIAEAAQEVVTRPGDLVARFGGEEFAVILPSTGNMGAMQVATEVCAAIRHRNLSHAASPYGIMTISVGCATMVPKLGQHAEDLIQMADEALYKAKRTGRNHVCNANAFDRILNKSKTDTLSSTANNQNL